MKMAIERFTPFGKSLAGPQENRHNEGFTGHIADTDTGLTYMQARHYDPVIGRFLSNDPVGFAEGGPAYFNRYAYTANDPVNNIDPDGRDLQSSLNAIGAHRRSTARRRAAIATQDMNIHRTQIRVVALAATPAAVAACSAACAAGAVVGAGSETARQVRAGEQLNGDKIAIAGVAGGLGVQRELVRALPVCLEVHLAVLVVVP